MQVYREGENVSKAYGLNQEDKVIARKLPYLRPVAYDKCKAKNVSGDRRECYSGLVYLYHLGVLEARE